MKKEYYGPPADIWASGVLLYTMMNGCFPFRGSSNRELYRKICKGYFKKAPCMSDEVYSLLKRILCPDVKARLTAEEILQDDWLKVPSTADSSEASG